MSDLKKEMITIQDKKILMSQTLNTLLTWGYLLNEWGWPKELPKKESYEDWMPDGRRDALGLWIKNRCGQREVSHYSNVIRSQRMTEEEFDVFYKGFYLGDRKCYRKDSYRTWRKIQDDGSPPPESCFKTYRFIWRLIFKVSPTVARKFTEWSFGYLKIIEEGSV